MTLLLPVAVLGACATAVVSPAWLTRIVPFAAAATLLLPAYHVMNDRVNPIYYLYHELAVLNTPPAVAMPELYELRAIHAMERGDLAAAETDLTLAIKLAPNVASPARQRGVLYASQGRWSDARRDFVRAEQSEPQNPDAWFLQAQASLAIGDTRSAQSEFDRARSLAPAEWINRPDVTRFAARLRQASH
jgi:Tfp pilus assembly protein PilF